jgi:hypothetical protein
VFLGVLIHVIKIMAVELETKIVPDLSHRFGGVGRQRLKVDEVELVFVTLYGI